MKTFRLRRRYRPLVVLIPVLLSLSLSHQSAPQPRTRLVKHFINLTNGLEAVPELQRSFGLSMNDVNYIRIQSTHCENSNYYGLLDGLDNNFMMHAALGNICLVYDYGSRGTGALIGKEDHRSGIPRSYWMGMEWIRHALASVWNLPESLEPKRNVRGYNSRGVFDEQLDKMPRPLRRRLKYFRPYLNTQTLHIYPIYAKTVNDGEKEYYYDLMRSLNRDTDVECTVGGGAKAVVSGLNEYEDVERYVRENCVPRGMHIYTSADFENIGNNKMGPLK